MKKILAYIFGLTAVLASCQHIEEEFIPASDQVTAEFDLTLTDAAPLTRAFADVPELSNLQIVVFDANGYRVESAEAVLTKVADLKYKYKVTLTATEEKRILHFIGNCSDAWKASLNEFGSERQLITTLEDNSGTGAFWQRIETTIKDANDLKNGLDGKVYLVRNYAKLSLSSDDANFTVKAMKVYNTPDRAFLAPYNSSTGEFILGYKDKTYAQLLEAFGASMPSDAALIGAATLNESDLIPATAGKATDFVYERPAATDATAPFIIVKGSYNGGPDTYYKVNLRDTEGGYYAILRGFNYDIKIVSVTGDGAGTLAGALASPGSGDITTDLKFLNVTNISNTESRIFISETSRTVVKQESVSIKFRYIPDLASGSTDNSLVTLSVGENDGHGNAISGTPVISASDDADGWRTITIQTTEPDPHYSKSQVITVIGTAPNGKTISRQFELTVRPTLKLIASCPVHVAETKGTAVAVTLGLESDLPESIFPLDVEIEAEAGTLAPAASEDMSVHTGTSLSGSGKPAFSYIRTVSYAEYTAGTTVTKNGITYKQIVCNFTTNKDKSATLIRAKSALFNLATCGFIKEGETLSLQAEFVGEAPVGNNKTVDLKFNVINQDPVTINMGNAKIGGQNIYTYIPGPECGWQTVTLDMTTFGDYVSVELSADNYNNQTLGLWRSLTIEQGSYNFSSIARTPCGFAAGATTAEMSFDLLNASGVKVASLPYTVTRTAVSGQTENGYFIQNPQGSVQVERNGFSYLIGNTYRYDVTISLTNYDPAVIYYYSTSLGATSGTVLTPSDINGNTAKLKIENLKNDEGTIYLYAKHSDYVSGTISCASVKYSYNGNNSQNSVSYANNGDGNYTPVLQKYTYTAQGPAENVTIKFDAEVTAAQSLTYKYDYHGSNGTKAFTLGVLSGDEAKPFDAGIFY